jgi:sugar/nucleoside kinase (ribokinase family)
MDFLAIGDTVMDDFIRLKDARVHCNLDDEECEISMRWGDKIPYDFHQVVPAVGNAANAAVAAARLGLSSGLRAHVGDDAYGAQCIASLAADQVHTDYIEKQKGKKTNYHYVLWFESQRTILVKHESFDYVVPELAEAPKWAYLSSLSENSLDYNLAWVRQLAPQTKLAFQPGTYQMKFGKEALAPVYARTDIFFCNKEEAERILGIGPTQDLKGLLAQIKALGPKVVVITDDVRGAVALDEANQAWFVPRYPDPRAPFEITGAGDAFASTTVAALALGKDLQTSLLWGATNASAVLQEIGAQKGLLTRAKLEENLAHPPAPFAVRPL